MQIHAMLPSSAESQTRHDSNASSRGRDSTHHEVLSSKLFSVAVDFKSYPSGSILECMWSGRYSKEPCLWSIRRVSTAARARVGPSHTQWHRRTRAVIRKLSQCRPSLPQPDSQPADHELIKICAIFHTSFRDVDSVSQNSCVYS